MNDKCTPISLRVHSMTAPMYIAPDTIPKHSTLCPGAPGQYGGRMACRMAYHATIKT